MVRPKSETEDFLLSITQICEMSIKQTHTKPQETLEIKLTQSRETFSLKPPISSEGCWIIGSTSSEVYNSVFNIIEKCNKFELQTDTSDEFSFS